MRGEHVDFAPRATALPGSSPHTRGAPVVFEHHGIAHGIIPACAGSTREHPSLSAINWDHPRIRGEHSPRTGKPVANQGSSPHTRGAPRLDRERAARRGIIPAYAGSTTAGGAASAARGDHPRIRGEHLGKDSAALRGRGSSPHTRGALQSIAFAPATVGIIPAYAGSTIPHVRRVPGERDHPRIRGEHDAR